MNWEKYPYFVLAIRYWWKGAGLDALPPIGRSLQEYLAAYGNEGQVKALDETLRGIPQDKWKRAMEDLSRKYPIKPPSISDITNAVIIENARFSLGDAALVGREVITDTANAFKFGLPLLLGVAVIAAVVIYMPKLREAKPA